MSSFNDISRWLHILVATLVVWSQGHIRAIFEKLDAGEYTMLGAVVLALVGMGMADKLLQLVIEHSRWIRRALSGRNDIEGDWVDAVVDSTNPRQIIYAEYSRVRYTKGQYVISGDTWTLNGNWVGEYSTTRSNYQGREFEYYYKAGINRVGGFGIIVYSPNDSLPSDSICRYLDEEIGTPHISRGQRLSTKLAKVPLSTRKAAALKFAEAFDQNGLIDLQNFSERTLGFDSTQH